MSELELGQEKLSSGDKNALKFQVWLDSKIRIDELTKEKIYDRETWTKLINPKTHKLSRVELIASSGVGDSALRQNPKIKNSLEELEIDLRKAKILPELTEVGKEEKDKPKQYDQSASKRFIDTKRLKDLEEENLRLKAEIKRFEELKEVMGDLCIGVEL